MYCPYCGKKNEDSATYCNGCGRNLKEDPGFTEPNQPAGSDPSDESNQRGWNQNRGVIIAIIIIVAAAVVAILFLTDVLPWPFQGRNSDVEIEETAEPAGTAGTGTATVRDSETETISAQENEVPENTEISVAAGSEETVSAPENNNPEPQATEEVVVYNKNGVSSSLYEVWNGNAVGNPAYVYGLTYSQATGDRMRISDLTAESDAEVLEKMKEALRIDQSAGYLTGTESQINSLTMNDIDNADDGLGLSFIVEGGEIVLLVSPGELYPDSSGFMRVPTKVYISTMSYDEYTKDYIFPDSDSRYLTRSDLSGLSKEELRLARNEIFARHGRIYDDENLNAYFSKRGWYHGTADEDHFDQSVFNDYEWKNLDLLNEYDGEMGYQNIGEL